MRVGGYQGLVINVMKHFTLLTAIALGSAAVPALANTELTVLQNQVEHSQTRIKSLEIQVAELQALLKANPDLRRQVTPQPSPAPASKGNSATYTVRAKDTFSAIGRKFGVSPQAIMQQNGIKDARTLRVGTVLQIPPRSVEGTLTTGATPSPSPTPASTPQTSGAHTNYTVQKNDTLYGISRRTGVPLWKIQAANPRVDASALRPGTVLNLVYSGDRRSATKRQVTPPAPKKQTTPERKAVVDTPPAPKPPQTQRADHPEPNFEDSSQAIRTVKVTREMTYGQFAQKHGISIAALNDLNGLKLTSSTPLAKGSELYVPGR